MNSTYSFRKGGNLTRGTFGEVPIPQRVSWSRSEGWHADPQGAYWGCWDSTFGWQVPRLEEDVTCIEEDNVYTPDSLVSLANVIYSEVYGYLDDVRFEADKVHEIYDWLEAGDLSDNPTLDTLVAEWREYEAEDGYFYRRLHAGRS